MVQSRRHSFPIAAASVLVMWDFLCTFFMPSVPGTKEHLKRLFHNHDGKEDCKDMDTTMERKGFPPHYFSNSGTH